MNFLHTRIQKSTFPFREMAYQVRSYPRSTFFRFVLTYHLRFEENYLKCENSIIFSIAFALAILSIHWTLSTGTREFPFVVRFNGINWNIEYFLFVIFWFFMVTRLKAKYAPNNVKKNNPNKKTTFTRYENPFPASTSVKYSWAPGEFHPLNWFSINATYPYRIGEVHCNQLIQTGTVETLRKRPPKIINGNKRRIDIANATDTSLKRHAASNPKENPHNATACSTRTKRRNIPNPDRSPTVQ